MKPDAIPDALGKWKSQTQRSLEQSDYDLGDDGDDVNNNDDEAEERSGKWRRPAWELGTSGQSPPAIRRIQGHCLKIALMCRIAHLNF